MVNSWETATLRTKTDSELTSIFEHAASTLSIGHKIMYQALNTMKKVSEEKALRYYQHRIGL